MNKFLTYLKQQGLTQNQIAQESGICKTSLSRFGRGKYTPSYKNMIKIAEAIEKLDKKVDMHEIFNIFKK